MEHTNENHPLNNPVSKIKKQRPKPQVVGQENNPSSILTVKINEVLRMIKQKRSVVEDSEVRPRMWRSQVSVPISRVKRLKKVKKSLVESKPKKGKSPRGSRESGIRSELEGKRPAMKGMRTVLAVKEPKVRKNSKNVIKMEDLIDLRSSLPRNIRVKLPEIPSKRKRPANVAVLETPLVIKQKYTTLPRVAMLTSRKLPSSATKINNFTRSHNKIAASFSYTKLGNFINSRKTRSKQK